MLMKKLSEEHYIVVDDSEIKIGDIVPERLLTGKYELFTIHTLNDIDRQTQKKVICSTQPLELICCTPVGQIKRYIDCKGCDRVTLGYNEVKPLSLSEVKELLGIVNAEMRTRQFVKSINATDEEMTAYYCGYRNALEDNKDKKYTEEDMKKMFVIGGGLSSFNDTDDNKFKYALTHIQPKTEWEVEFVDEKLRLK